VWYWVCVWLVCDRFGACRVGGWSGVGCCLWNVEVYVGVRAVVGVSFVCVFFFIGFVGVVFLAVHWMAGLVGFVRVGRWRDVWRGLCRGGCSFFRIGSGLRGYGRLWYQVWELWRGLRLCVVCVVFCCCLLVAGVVRCWCFVCAVGVGL